uniref:Late blight resistance protein homolog R1A-3 n=1 Tax=Nicotiana tabacum TaxID=4097 RepID=A0A1S4CCM7_TOBAC|nr:PREDICTED: putative late blight resistance protein homolog R1A-3 [Nicotiana tabacum]
MAHNDIEDMLDHLRRIKRRGDVNVVKTETLEMELRFWRTFFKYPHTLLPDSLVEVRKKAKLIAEMLYSVFGGIPGEYKTSLNVERLVSELQEFSEDNGTSLIDNFELNDSYMFEYMDHLDQNLNDAPRYLVRSITFFAKKINIPQKTDRYLRKVKVIQNRIRFIRYLYGAKINGYVDREKLEGMHARIQFMADNVRQFCLALWINKDRDDTSDIENKPPYLLCLVVIVELEMKKIFLCELKASKFTQSRTFKNKKLPKGFSYQLHCFLVYLRDKKLDNFPTIVSARNIDVAIEFLLVFLSDIPNHVISGNRLNEVLEKVGVLAGDILYVIQMKLLSGSTIKYDASKIDLGTMHILEKIEDLKAQVEERYYRSVIYKPSQFPTVGGLSFLDSLLRKLNEMLKSKSGLDFMLKPHIVILEKELSHLTSIFRDVAKVQHEHEILKDLQRHTINLAYEAEVSIDSILSQCNALWYLFCSLPAIVKEIKNIREKVTEMRFKNLLPLKPYSLIEPSKHPPNKHSNLRSDEEIVGFENDTKSILRLLIRGTNELDVIPIVGMGGQGKTTIAKKVYNNDNVVSHFDVQAWCIISQIHNRRELLQEIFSQVTGSANKVDEVGALADILRKSLVGKRYLIVLDDIWDGMAWDDLRLSFPDGRNGSRIVVTTRLDKVAEDVKHHSDPYFLPFLTPEESRELLQKKVFQNEACPPELNDVSLDVARRCKGLPLVVVLVAGIIKKKKMERSWWHEIKKALFSYLDRESKGYSRATMQLSYDNLPEYLRPCLLYMGMFPEDERIPVSKLISLWIAEGFVQNIESDRLMEEIAEGYLMDLIRSNVVMVSRRTYNGKVKYCQVHDVVLHFCLERSREETFILAVRGNIQPSDLKVSRVSFSKELSMFASKMRKPFHQHLRSLITTNRGESLYWNRFSQVINLMRLLKVLDLSSHKFGCFSLATLKPLIHLKYVALFIDTFDFCGKSHLPHLETLILKCSMYTWLSENFWKMKKLRHVEFTSAGLFLVRQIIDESSKLENLRILRGVTLTLGFDCLNVLVQRCPNLQELEITFLAYDSDEEMICLKLESLTQLQSLRFFFRSSTVVPKLHLPSNVKKLLLCGPRIGSAIFFIAGLANLEYLELREPNFLDSGEWCLGDITFPKLKLLKLSNLGISKWDASEESFPQLETLVINGCNDLEEIPLSFADIPTLKQIKLMWCSHNKSLKASAVRIKKEVEENEGCDRIDLIIVMHQSRMSEKLKKLQDLCPKMDKQTSITDILDLAAQHIRTLEDRVQNLKILSTEVENYKRGGKESTQ